MLLKQNLSVSLSFGLIEQIDKLKEKLKLSRSEVVELFLKNSLEKELLKDAEQLSKMNFEDLPNEEDWIKLQSN